jgi:hypothetical protein
LLLLNEVNPKFTALETPELGAMVRMSLAERRVAVVAEFAVVAFPVIFIPHVPLAPPPVRVGE